MSQYLTQIIETNSIPGKTSWNSGIDPLCRNKSPPLLHVAVYWQGKNTEACAKKLPQILETTLIIGEGELVSEFMEGVVAIDRYVNAKYSLRYELITTKNKLFFTPGTVWVI